jgi:hypothetical protein
LAGDLVAGCNRYGIDNPCPIITKRLSLYGNSDDLLSDFKKLAEKFNKDYPGMDIDPDVYGPAELKLDTKQTLETLDFKETECKSPLRKKAGILNLNLLNK